MNLRRIAVLRTGLVPCRSGIVPRLRGRLRLFRGSAPGWISVPEACSVFASTSVDAANIAPLSITPTDVNSIDKLIRSATSFSL